MAVDENKRVHWLSAADIAFVRERGRRYATVSTWALDFWRAFRERPHLYQRITQLCMGRYAWRELIGMREALEEAGCDPSLPYELEDMEYHHGR